MKAAYPNIKIKIYTSNITKQLNLDYQKYQKQYQNIVDSYSTLQKSYENEVRKPYYA
jgi:hypothetical protein